MWRSTILLSFFYWSVCAAVAGEKLQAMYLMCSGVVMLAKLATVSWHKWLCGFICLFICHRGIWALLEGLLINHSLWLKPGVHLREWWVRHPCITSDIRRNLEERGITFKGKQPLKFSLDLLSTVKNSWAEVLGICSIKKTPILEILIFCCEYYKQN